MNKGAKKGRSLQKTPTLSRCVMSTKLLAPGLASFRGEAIESSLPGVEVADRVSDLKDVHLLFSLPPVPAGVLLQEGVRTTRMALLPRTRLLGR